MVTRTRKVRGSRKVGAGEETLGGAQFDAAHARYHNAQADPKKDTAAKRLARAAGLPTVQCSCGEWFPV